MNFRPDLTEVWDRHHLICPLPSQYDDRRWFAWMLNVLSIMPWDISRQSLSAIERNVRDPRIPR